MLKHLIYQGRAEGLRLLLDEWQAQHHSAMELRDVEDLVQEASSTIELLLQSQKELWNNLRCGRIPRVISVGQNLRKAYLVCEGLIKAVEPWILAKEAENFQVEGGIRFRSLINQVADCQRVFEEKWPFPHHEEIASAIVAFDRGEGRELGDWIRELQSEGRA